VTSPGPAGATGAGNPAASGGNATSPTPGAPGTPRKTIGQVACEEFARAAPGIMWAKWEHLSGELRFAWECAADEAARAARNYPETPETR
jgi:hypothetical protein